MQNKKTEIENEFEEIVQSFIGEVGKKYYEDMVTSNRKNAVKAFQSYAFESGQNAVDEMFVTEQIGIRKWLARSRGLQEEDRKNCESLCAMVGDVLSHLGQAKLKEEVLNGIYDYYEKQIDYSTSEEAKNKIASRQVKIDAVLNTITELRTEAGYIKECSDLVIEAMLGSYKDEFLRFQRGEVKKEAKKSWDAYLESAGYRYLEGISAKESSKIVEEMVQNASLPVETMAVMDIQSFDPKFGKEIVKAMQTQNVSMLSDEHCKVAAQNFDIVLDTYFDERKKSELKNQGLDVFDFVFIDGKSMNELYAEKYADKSYYRAAELMKCEFLADALQGKDVEIFMFNQEKKPLIPLQVESKMPEIQEWKAALPKRESINERGYEAQIKVSLEKLGVRKNDERIAKAVRMANDTALELEGMGAFEKSKIVAYKPVFRTQNLHDSYMNMRVPEGSLSENPNINGICGEFDALMNGIGYSRSSLKFFKQAGIVDTSELFYIDGKPANDYVKDLYPNRTFDIKNDNDGKIIKAEIFAAVLSGTHRIETVTVGVEKGAYQVGINQVKMDLTDFDKGVKFYQTKPSSMVDKLIKHDRGKETRHDAIRAHFSQKLAAGVAREVNRREAVAYEKAKKAMTDSVELGLERLSEKKAESIKKSERMTFQDLLKAQTKTEAKRERKTTIQIGKQKQKVKEGPTAKM